jgi:hypothetical protein
MTCEPGVPFAVLIAATRQVTSPEAQEKSAAATGPAGNKTSKINVDAAIATRVNDCRKAKMWKDVINPPVRFD